MTEQRLIALLASLVARERLTPEEARAVLDAYRSGDLPNLWPYALGEGPGLALALGTPAALYALLAALRRVTGPAALVSGLRAVLEAAAASTGPSALTAAPRAVAPAFAYLGGMPREAREALMEGILDAAGREYDRRAALLFRDRAPADAFIARVRAEAGDPTLGVGDIARRFPGEAARLGIGERNSYGDLRRFHVAMRQAIREDALALAQLGAGRPLTPSDLAALNASVAEQEAYLQRFVDEVAARQAVEAEGGRRAMTEKEVAARARMYRGEARGAYYRAASAAEAAPGVVVYYDARDDGGTCSPCYAAERGGPYLPGTDHPVPGAVCDGRGHCRCALRFAYEPATYARLTGAADGATRRPTVAA